MLGHKEDMYGIYLYFSDQETFAIMNTLYLIGQNKASENMLTHTVTLFGVDWNTAQRATSAILQEYRENKDLFNRHQRSTMNLALRWPGSSMAPAIFVHPFK
jgi:hypothetical protein